tara:strand:+ start:249 stop:464 length:216 start_codon:yes stop_codon:yes gene_type:complete
MATKFYNPENNTMANGRSQSLVNGHADGVNGTSGPKPLDIAIIGAGIGGLSAAIGLRKNGHKVSVSSVYFD